MASNPQIARNNSFDNTAYHYLTTYGKYVQNQKKSLLVSRASLGCCTLLWASHL